MLFLLEKQLILFSLPAVAIGLVEAENIFCRIALNKSSPSDRMKNDQH